MSSHQFDPRPVFELIADSLVEAIKYKDWEKVKEIYEQIKKLAEYG